MQINVKMLGGTLVGVVIMVVLFATVLVPVVDDATNDVGTTYSNPGANVELYEDVSGLSYDIIYNASTHTISGYTASTSNFVIITDVFTISMSQSSSFFFMTYHDTSDSTYYARSMSYSSSITAVEITVVGSDLNVTITGGTPSTITETISWLAISDDDGAYHYADSSASAQTYHLNGVSQAYMVKYQGGNYSVLAAGSATYNGNEASVYYNPTDITGIVNTKTATSADLGVTYNETNYTSGYSIVPASVQGYSNSTDSAVISIVEIIPLLVLVGIVIMVVRSYLNRD